MSWRSKRTAKTGERGGGDRRQRRRHEVLVAAIGRHQLPLVAIQGDQDKAEFPGESFPFPVRTGSDRVQFFRPLPVWTGSRQKSNGLVDVGRLRLEEVAAKTEVDDLPAEARDHGVDPVQPLEGVRQRHENVAARGALEAE